MESGCPLVCKMPSHPLIDDEEDAAGIPLIVLLDEPDGSAANWP